MLLQQAPSELAESHLFGHVRGAFSGAHQDHDGWFRAADRGTLFLDEIGEMPLLLQTKLLRVLETKQVYPVGSTRGIAVDVQVIAATNRELRPTVDGSGFRGDLYARLAMHVLRMPPLRQRREDILPLLLRELGEPTPPLTARLCEALLLYEWPFNVRQLLQIAGTLKLHAKKGTPLDVPLIADRLFKPQAPATDPSRLSPSQPPRAPNEPPSRELLLRLVKQHRGVVARVAADVDRSHRQVRRLLEQYGIDAKQFF